MTPAVYEAVAFGMRYWFIIAIAVILVAVILISVKEYRTRKEAFTRVNAFSGYLEIVAGPDDLIGEKFGICEENLIGSAENSDIRVDDESVRHVHASLYIENGSVFLNPLDESDTYINGRQIFTAEVLRTGDLVGVGDIDMCLHLKRKRVRDDY